MANTIKSIEQLIEVMNNAKNGGQFATIIGESEIRLNKFPTDGSERVRIADGFIPKSVFSVEYHFGADYEKKMAKVLGVSEYEAHDANRVHIVPNLIMQYVSTGTICLIYMPSGYKKIDTTLNGVSMSAEEIAYMKRYQPKASASVVEYRTLNVMNVREIHFGGEIYYVDIECIKTKAA